MNINLNKGFSLEKENKSKESYNKSITKDGITKEVSVREVENGFLIRLTKFGEYPNEKTGKKEYNHYEKEYISKTNPFEEDPQRRKLDEMDGLFTEGFTF